MKKHRCYLITMVVLNFVLFGVSLWGANRERESMAQMEAEAERAVPVLQSHLSERKKGVVHSIRENHSQGSDFIIKGIRATGGFAFVNGVCWLGFLCANWKKTKRPPAKYRIVFGRAARLFLFVGNACMATWLTAKLSNLREAFVLSQASTAKTKTYFDSILPPDQTGTFDVFMKLEVYQSRAAPLVLWIAGFVLAINALCWMAEAIYFIKRGAGGGDAAHFAMT